MTAALSFSPRVNLHRWSWDAFAIRYVRTAAGARRYGVPIGSPIPTGRRVSNRSMPDGSTRIRLTPAQRSIAGRIFGEESGPNGASHGGGVNLDVDNPAAASSALDRALAGGDLTAGQRRSVRVLRDKVAGLAAPQQDSGGAGPPAADPDPSTRTPEQVQADIRGAYDSVASGPGDWVGLVELRRELDSRGLTREQIDAALEEMAATPGVHVAAEPNQKALTPEDRAAAVRFGGDDRHMLMIEPDGGEQPDAAPARRAAQAAVDLDREEADAASGLFFGPESGGRLQGGRLDVTDRAAAIATLDTMISGLAGPDTGEVADLRRTYERIRERIQQAPEEQ